MTTYKIGEVLTDRDGCARVKMEEDTAGGWVRKADVQELLRKQREADAQAAFAFTFGWGGYEISPQDVMQRRLELKQAILNAKVEHGTT